MLNRKTYSEVSDDDFKILSKSKTQPDFWENAHERQESFWTSGTSFEVVTTKLKVTQKLRNKNVLVVGVGQGQELYGFQKKVLT
jgi:hypothetical protein